jgi:hypothetical protein
MKMKLFANEEKWDNFGGNINIYSDLKETDIHKIIKEPNIHSLQFYEFTRPSEKTWQVLEHFYQQYPHIGLHIFWSEKINFDFLRHLPSVKRLAVSSNLTKDFSPIKDHLNLEELSLGGTKSKAVDLEFISSFKNLKTFYNDGMKKGIEVLAKSNKLENLTLRCVKLNDLKFIENHPNLRELNLLYGSYKSLESIASLKQLKRLEISRTRQISNYNFLNKLSNLESLCLEGLSKLDSIPSLDGLVSLTKIQIDNNSQLKDITNLNQLRKLETFLLFYPKEFKSALRKGLTEQALGILKTNETIQSTNLWRLMSDQERVVLKAKNIDFWGYNPAVEKQFNKKSPETIRLQVV